MSPSGRSPSATAVTASKHARTRRTLTAVKNLRPTRRRLGAEDDVELAQQRPVFDVAGGFERHDHARPRRGIADGAQEKIAVVARLTGDIHLGRQPGCCGRPDDEVDMRRASGIGHRADGAEAIGAVGCGYRAAVALKILILTARTVGHVVLDAEPVALPDLELGALHRPAVDVEHPSDHMQAVAGGLPPPAA